MNIFILLLLVFVALLLVGIAFKLAKFVLKLVSLVLLFVFLIWIGLFLYDASVENPVDRLYVVEYNDSFGGYTLTGDKYNFTELESDEAKELFTEFDVVYLVSYDTLKRTCISNTTVLDCVRNVSFDTIWTQINMTQADN